jgi:probable F420-dependent oxidoreductase
MKFGLIFANMGPLGAPDTLMGLAQTAERVGIESLWTVEHTVVPVGYRSTYPYDKSGRMPVPDDMPFPDPLLPLAYVAAVTEKIRLATGILILPQRHPIYVAKEVATLDVLSRGRMILGIGVGWLAEEFEALGVPFADRAARTRESVAAIRTLWKEGPQSFDGKFFHWGPIESNPKPVQRPGVPIVVGGHTEIAARRAARYGDGFLPGVVDEDTLAHLLAILREECARIGRRAEDIEITYILPSPNPDSVRRLRDAGVKRICIGPPGLDLESVRAGLERFAERVLNRLDG